MKDDESMGQIHDHDFTHFDGFSFSVSCDVSWHRKDGQRYMFLLLEDSRVFPIVVCKTASKTLFLVMFFFKGMG